MLPTELAPMTANDRRRLECHLRSFFGAGFAAQNALMIGGILWLSAGLSTILLERYLDLPKLTICAFPIAAGLVGCGLSLLHHHRVVAPRDRERIGAVEHDLERGQVEVLSVPDIHTVVLLAHRGGEHEVSYTAFLGFEEQVLVDEWHPEEPEDVLWEGDPPRLRGREVRLVRAPASRHDLPARSSGEAVSVHEVLDEAELSMAWYPVPGELLACRAEDIRSLLEGPAPTSRVFVWT